MTWRAPIERPQLVRQLKRLYEADAAGRKSHANTIFLSLPDEARGVLSLLKYAGRFRGWQARSTKPRGGRRLGVSAMLGYFGRFEGWQERVVELKRLRKLVAENPPDRGTLH